MTNFRPIDGVREAEVGAEVSRCFFCKYFVSINNGAPRIPGCSLIDGRKAIAIGYNPSSVKTEDVFVANEPFSSCSEIDDVIAIESRTKPSGIESSIACIVDGSGEKQIVLVVDKVLYRRLYAEICFAERTMLDAASSGSVSPIDAFVTLGYSSKADKGKAKSSHFIGATLEEWRGVACIVDIVSHTTGRTSTLYRSVSHDWSIPVSDKTVDDDNEKGIKTKTSTSTSTGSYVPSFFSREKLWKSAYRAGEKVTLMVRRYMT